MKYGDNPHHFKKQKKYKIHAPKRKSLGYWIHIIFFAFIIPLILTGVSLGFLLNAIANSFAFLTFFISPFVAFYIAWKTHVKMLRLSDDEYEKRFNVQANVESHESQLRKNNPYDPASSLYWTMGPGGTRYNDR